MKNLNFITLLVVMAYVGSANASNPFRWLGDAAINAGRLFSDPFDYKPVQQSRREAAQIRALNTLCAQLLADALIEEIEKQDDFAKSDKLVEAAVQKNPYGSRAKNILESRGYSTDPSMPFLTLFENDFQVQAIDLLTSFKKKDIFEKVPGIIGFKNQEAVDALKVLLVNGKEINRRIFYLARFESAEQVDFLRRNIYKISFEDICARILREKTFYLNDFGYQAAKAMQGADRDFLPSYFMVKDFTNPFQAAAVDLLILHKQFNIKNHIPAILSFNNKHSVEAMRLILEANRTLGQTVFYLAFVNNDLQVQAIAELISKEKPIRANLPKILQMGSKGSPSSLSN